MKLRKHKLNYLTGQIKRMAKEGLFTYFNNKPTMAKEVNRAELPSIAYPARLNPFKSASSKMKLEGGENVQLNEFLKKAVSV